MQGSELSLSRCIARVRGALADMSKRDKFARDVLVVLSGSGLSQAIAIGTMPLVSRLYTPSDFGVWSLLLALVAIPASIACAKYELAIHIPERDEDALALVALAVSLGAVMSVLCLIIIAVFGNRISTALGGGVSQLALWTVPPMVFLSAAYAAVTYWFKRRGRFRAVASNNVLTRAAVAAIQVGLGWWKAGAAGLVIGGVTGQATTLALLTVEMKKRDRGLFAGVGLGALTHQARRYKEFPRFLIPSGLMEVTSAQLPSLFFSSLFGIGVLGAFSMANRMVSLPMSLLGNSVRDVFWQAASREYSRHGNCKQLFVRTAFRLAALGVVPAAIILIAGPALFAFVFGSEWSEAGQFARLLGVMFWLRFVSSPLSSMFYIAEKQQLDLVLQVTVFLVLLSLFGLVQWTGMTATNTVLVYGIVYSLKYILEFVLSFRFAGGFAVAEGRNGADYGVEGRESP